MFADEVRKAERDRREAELVRGMWRRPSLWRRLKRAFRRAFSEDYPGKETSYDEQDPLYVRRDREVERG